MFNTTTIGISNNKTIIQEAENINCKIEKSNPNSFFITATRNSPKYNRLFGENPHIIDYQWIPWRGGEATYAWERMDQLCGGRNQEVKISVTVLSIQYSGENNFIFELCKKL